VIAAAQGYPGSVRSGDPIEGSLKPSERVQIFHAGTQRLADGRCVSSGGRVLAVVAQDNGFDAAFAKAYRALEQVHFDGMVVRRDIGHQVRSH
jgi:phosphoribosylamine--glycine ligase